jgi:hypothetical protein
MFFPIDYNIFREISEKSKQIAGLFGCRFWKKNDSALKMLKLYFYVNCAYLILITKRTFQISWTTGNLTRT